MPFIVKARNNQRTTHVAPILVTPVEKNTTATSAPIDRPVHLYHVMTLLPGRRLVVTCDAPIATASQVIHAKTPMLLEAPRKHRVTLHPQISLGADFVRGWNKLPPELKVHTLGFNLISPDDQPATEKITTSVLHPFLRMTDEIATLARETFYKQNCVCLEVKDRGGVGRTLRYPPSPSNHLIRRLKFRLDLHKSDTPRFWPKITDLADGKYGFPNLRFLRLNLPVFSRDESPMSLLDNLGVLRLKCDGDYHLWWMSLLGTAPQEQAEFEDAVRKLLVFRA